MATEPRKNPAGKTANPFETGIVLNDGKPFDSQESAALAMQKHALSYDDWEIIRTGNGFAISRLAADVITDVDAAIDDINEAANAAAVVPAEKPQAEQYKWVRFHNKSNHMDPDEVVLAVNGEVLQVRRNMRVPLPQRFLEVANNARYKHFTQEPGKDRKVDCEIHKYPYDVLGDATREDFVTFKRSGTKAVRENAERLGISVEA